MRSREIDSQSSIRTCAWAADQGSKQEWMLLAPGLSPLRALWDSNELAVVHAMAIPHRTRSHFDGQAILETGLDHPAGSADGWLNRLLQVMSGRRSGIAIAAGLPRALSGPGQVGGAGPRTAPRAICCNLGHVISSSTLLTRGLRISST